jgi:hypothetical protein
MGNDEDLHPKLVVIDRLPEQHDMERWWFKWPFEVNRDYFRFGLNGDSGFPSLTWCLEAVTRLHSYRTCHDPNLVNWTSGPDFTLCRRDNYLDDQKMWAQRDRRFNGEKVNTYLLTLPWLTVMVDCLGEPRKEGS